MVNNLLTFEVFSEYLFGGRFPVTTIMLVLNQLLERRYLRSALLWGRININLWCRIFRILSSFVLIVGSIGIYNLL